MRVLCFDDALRLLVAFGDRGVAEDEVCCSKLTIAMYNFCPGSVD